VERRHRKTSLDPQLREVFQLGRDAWTAGGLVFSGGTADRMFRALDASTGEVLWEYPTNSRIMAPPSSFMVDGKQYIAVVPGWGIDPRSMQNRLNRVRPCEFPEVPEGGAIWVFAIK
jgi:alcohol dehydrogenase (cytochrome c)